MTSLEILELFGEADDRYILQAQALRSKAAIPVQKTIPARKLWVLIAAVLTALALSLTVYAVIHARIQMKLVPIISTPTAPETGALLSRGYPRAIPEAYTLQSISPAAQDSQSMLWTHPLGCSLQFVLSVSDELASFSPPPLASVQKETVDIAGTDGTMVTVGDYQRLLFWKLPAETLYGILISDDQNLDLPALAASTAPGELPIPISQPQADYAIQISQEGEAYVAFEPYYPTLLPDGFSISFVSDRAYGEQSVLYRNAEGEEIRYLVYYRLGSYTREFFGTGEARAVSIQGIPGYWIQDGDMQEILWANEEKGFAFDLKTSAKVDILAIAQSVAPGEELPATNAAKTAQAMAQLGNYQITVFPEAMQPDGLSGWPLENDNDWYSYVRRWYVNPTNNHQLFLEYSTWRAEPQEPQTMQEIANAYAGMDAQEVTINGCVGATSVSEGHSRIVWLTGTSESGICFQLVSDNLSIEELLAAAQSVQEVGVEHP